MNWGPFTTPGACTHQNKKRQIVGWVRPSLLKICLRQMFQWVFDLHIEPRVTFYASLRWHDCNWILMRGIKYSGQQYKLVEKHCSTLNRKKQNVCWSVLWWHFSQRTGFAQPKFKFGGLAPPLEWRSHTSCFSHSAGWLTAGDCECKKLTIKGFRGKKKKKEASSNLVPAWRHTRFNFVCLVTLTMTVQ